VEIKLPGAPLLNFIRNWLRNIFIVLDISETPRKVEHRSCVGSRDLHVMMERATDDVASEMARKGGTAGGRAGSDEEARTVVEESSETLNGKTDDEDESGSQSSSESESSLEDTTSDESDSEDDSHDSGDVPVPDLRARLATFLPQISKANETLSDAQRIDDVGDDEQQYIEMNLGLGVLSEQKQSQDEIQTRLADSGTESDDDSNPSRELKLTADTSDQPAKKRRKVEEVAYER
jgi:Domain of unknown function (DUF4598)